MPLTFELLFQKFLFNFNIKFTKVTSSDRELDADFIGVYFIMILKENINIYLGKSYQRKYYHHNITNSVCYIYLLWELLLALVIKFQHKRHIILLHAFILLTTLKIIVFC